MMQRFLIVVALVGLGACLRSESITCADGRTCPSDRKCDEVGHTCVLPDQLVSCVGLADASDCTIDGKPVGVCRQEVCVEAVCGDGVRHGDEVCDGSAPTSGTCVDFNYGYGDLTCSSLCTEALADCHPLGWQFRALPGTGQVNAIWQDGDTVWLATAGGLLSRASGTTTWTELGQVTPTTIDYRGIWAGQGHVFAVGNAGSAAHLVHYDGTAWTEQTIDNLALGGVWARSPTDAFAVGTVGGGTGDGRIYRYDGTSWADATGATQAYSLTAVWGIDNAVYVAGNVGGIYELVGSAWNVMTVIGGNDLRSIWGSDATNVFVAGDLVVHRLDVASHKWLPMLGMATNNLRSISGRSPTEIYAVGDATNPNPLVNAFVFDGTGWRAMLDVPREPFFAVSAGPAGVFMGKAREMFLEYEGVGWGQSLKPPMQNRVNAVWAAAPDFEIGAADGCNVYEYKPQAAGLGASWSQLALGCSNNQTRLLSVWGTSNTNAYAGGPGVLFRRVPGAWAPVTLPNTKTIYAISGSGPDDIYAVGADAAGTEPNLLHGGGMTFTDLSSQVMPLANVLRGVWARASNDVFAVGFAGTILHFDGATWTAMTSGVTADLMDVWGTSATNVYAVGTGVVLHYDGTAWSEVAIPAGATVPTQTAFAKIHGTGPDDIYVVGLRTLLHFDGTAWGPIARPDTSALTGVWASSGLVSVAGDDGAWTALVGTLAP